MKLFAQMVTKNEAGRYLDSCLAWLEQIVDGIHVFDDQSEDETPEMVLSRGHRLSVRDDETPAFLEHEGRFRQAAWDAFERKLEPVPGDWVLAIDADEFLVAKTNEREALFEHAERANQEGAWSVIIPVPEVFDCKVAGQLLFEPKVRVDGYWGTIAGTRFFRYEIAGKFGPKPMGSGSEPTYVQAYPKLQSQGLWLFHYGYAAPEDRETKYDRYTKLVENGHNNAHIQSILQPPELKMWESPRITVWRGPAE